jgi:hypothetical protein
MKGGVLSALDHLDTNPHHMGDYIIGLKIIVGIAHTQHGFKNSAIALRAMFTSLHALRVFDFEPEVIQYSFLALGELNIRFYYLFYILSPTVKRLVSEE